MKKDFSFNSRECLIIWTALSILKTQREMEISSFGSDTLGKILGRDYELIENLIKAFE